MVSRLLQDARRARWSARSRPSRSTSRTGSAGEIRDIAWLSPTSIVVLHPVGRRALPGPQRVGRRRARRRRRPVADPRRPGHRPGRDARPAAEHLRDHAATEDLALIDLVRALARRPRGRAGHHQPRLRRLVHRSATARLARRGPRRGLVRCPRPARRRAVDLLLGGRCVGCARPGRPLCASRAAPTCRAEPFASVAGPGAARPRSEPWACAAYDGTARALVLGLKERRLLGLARPLAALLAAAAARRAPPAARSCSCRCRRAPRPSGRAATTRRARSPAGRRPRCWRRPDAMSRPRGCCGCGPASSTRPGLDAAGARRQPGRRR